MSQILEKPEVRTPEYIPISAQRLEQILRSMGAEIVRHVVRYDPIAKLKGEVVAFWTE